jgi:RND family efflux transporter MFP subunit
MTARRRAIWMWSALGLLLALGVVAGVMLVARRADGNGAPKKKKGDEPTAASPVEITEVHRGRIATYLTTTTTLEPRNSATLVAKRTGEVKALIAEEGQWVEKGAVLARLEDEAARLAVERAEVEAEMTKRELDRGQQLKAQGYMSDQEIEATELKKRSAQVALAQARHDLEQTRIVAPFAGRVSERLIQLGETVTAGKECFRVVDMTPLLARIYFPERELGRVRVGQPATVTIDSRPDRSFQAKVSLVNPVVDRGSGTFKVTLEVHDSEGVLKPGSFARAQIRTGEFDDALVLPRRAMLEEDGESYVYVAKGDTVARVGVRLGAVAGDSAQVLAGLVPGDRVVTVGQGGLKPGARIKSVRF